LFEFDFQLEFDEFRWGWICWSMEGKCKEIGLNYKEWFLYVFTTHRDVTPELGITNGEGQIWKLSDMRASQRVYWAFFILFFVRYFTFLVWISIRYDTILDFRIGLNWTHLGWLGLVILIWDFGVYSSLRS